MQAHDTLSQIVEQEARKLLKRSEASTNPLEGNELEALEVLARCTKTLRAPSNLPTQPSASDNMTDEEALALLTK